MSSVIYFIYSVLSIFYTLVFVPKVLLWIRETPIRTSDLDLSLPETEEMLDEDEIIPSSMDDADIALWSRAKNDISGQEQKGTNLYASN